MSKKIFLKQKTKKTIFVFRKDMYCGSKVNFLVQLMKTNISLSIQ